MAFLGPSLGKRSPSGAHHPSRVQHLARNGAPMQWCTQVRAPKRHGRVLLLPAVPAVVSTGSLVAIRGPAFSKVGCRNISRSRAKVLSLPLVLRRDWSAGKELLFLKPEHSSSSPPEDGAKCRFWDSFACLVVFKRILFYIIFPFLSHLRHTWLITT